MKRRDLLLLRTTSVRNMEKELTYRSVFPVLESCDMLCRRVPNYQDEVGGKLFLKALQRNPRVLTFFGASSTSHGRSSRDHHDDADDCGDLSSSPSGASRFVFHVTMMLDLLHHALGPDVESLDEILFDVGRRHAALGLCDEPELFEIMLSCLVEVVDELVGLSDQAQKAWKVVTNALVTSLSTAVQATKWEEQQRHSTRESRRNGQLLPASPTSVRRGSDW